MVVLEQIQPALYGLNPIFQYIDSIEALTGVAVDAPLIIKNEQGQRACENGLSKVYGSRKASCHTSNLRLFPNALSVRFSKMILDKGFKHLGPKKFQIECYPHPAIIEFFGLTERLKYKKGKVADKKKGQQKLAFYLLRLSESPTLKLVIPDHFRRYFDDSFINTLKGKALKSNEDALDAVVCLYIAALYSSQASNQTFGDSKEGYIWVPTGMRI